MMLTHAFGAPMRHALLAGGLLAMSILGLPAPAAADAKVSGVIRIDYEDPDRRWSPRHGRYLPYEPRRRWDHGHHHGRGYGYGQGYGRGHDYGHHWQDHGRRVWVPAHWQRRGWDWVWVPGHWR